MSGAAAAPPTEKAVARWTDRSDPWWPVEVVPAWAYDQLKKRADQLEAALKQFGSHTLTCTGGRINQFGVPLDARGPCSCGFDAAKEQAG